MTISSGCSTAASAGRRAYQNNTASPFSYAVLDGFDVPMALVHVFDRPRESLRSIELFTDGYFSRGDPDVAAWEAAFAEVERIDPEKIDALSVGQGHGRPHPDRRPDGRDRPPLTEDGRVELPARPGSALADARPVARLRGR